MMLRAFFVKDLRLASRVGAPLPGIGSLLVVQAAFCLGAGAFTIFLGPIFPGIWKSAPSLIGTVAFVLAYIGPATQAAIAAAGEGNPDIAESLSTAPLGPTQFLLGKAALPAVQGLALQATLLPAWLFLTANGMVSTGDALRIVVATMIAVPVGAITGASRFGGPGSPRVALLMKAAAKRGVTSPPISGASSQQTWVALLGLAWMVQVMRGIGVGVPALGNPVFGTFQDVVRPILPIVGMERGWLAPMFGAPVPVLLLSVILLVALGANRLAMTVASSPRASASERGWSWKVVLVARTIFVLYLAGATWAISPAVSGTVAALVALLYALGGQPLRDGANPRIELAALSLVPCALPAAATTALAGLPGLAFWAGVAVMSVTGSAAMPPPRADSDRRLGAALAVLFVGFATPVVTAALLLPGSALREFSSLAPVFAAWSWVSLPAAVFSLASLTLGPLLPWITLEQAAPSLSMVPPWIGAPALFGLVALVALARASLKRARAG